MTLLEQAEAEGVRGFLHPSELQKLHELAADKDVLEIGSFMGLSAWGMAQTARSVMCVDPFRANSAGQEQMPEITTLNDFKRAIARFNNVRYFVGTSEEADAIIAEDYDMIFLDAMHTYADVKADIARWWPRVRDVGVFAMHDYRHAHYPGVEQAADEVFGPAPEGTTVVTLRWITKP